MGRARRLSVRLLLRLKIAAPSVSGSRFYKPEGNHPARLAEGSGRTGAEDVLRGRYRRVFVSFIRAGVTIAAHAMPNVGWVCGGHDHK